MYCEICGSEVRDGEKFCPVCGEEIRGALRTVDPKPTHRGIGGKPKWDDWYTYNWERLGNGAWQGEELKHHLAWLGIHLGVIFLLCLIIVAAYGGIGQTKTRRLKHESTGADRSIGSEWGVDGFSTESIDDAVGDFEDQVTELADDIGSDIDYYTKVAFNSLDGTWTDRSGAFTLVISRDGTVRITDPTGTLGADVFTYTEVDDDTVSLKANSNDFLMGAVSINMDYQVKGETLTVSVLGLHYDLTRKK